MAWARPLNPIVQVNAAGRQLGVRGIASLPQNELAIINNWRSSHSFPLNTFQNDLRRKTKNVDENGVIAQRIKRLESIHTKFQLNPTMRLVQMQDIGGCRAIVGSVADVYRLIDKYKRSRFAHTFKNEKDYIAQPKADGYRSYHRIYQYKGRGATACYDGLHVEVQIRTQLQHAWATAVEIVGTITKQALKSKEGTPDWRRFFSLVSAAFAALEGTADVPGITSDKDYLTAEIRDLYERLRVWDTIASYRIAIQQAGVDKNFATYVLELNYDKHQVSWWGFSKKQSQGALYVASERERMIRKDQNIQVVMVAVDHLSQLRRAYPNYFMDIDYFAAVLTEIMSGKYIQTSVSEGA
jgi:hypothetical protein